MMLTEQYFWSLTNLLSSIVEIEMGGLDFILISFLRREDPGEGLDSWNTGGLVLEICRRDVPGAGDFLRMIEMVISGSAASWFDLVLL
jgi:hypothetical protein